jgi:hypothetical protein
VRFYKNVEDMCKKYARICKICNQELSMQQTAGQWPERAENSLAEVGRQEPQCLTQTWTVIVTDTFVSFGMHFLFLS